MSHSQDLEEERVGRERGGFSVSLTASWESQVEYVADNWEGGSSGRIRAERRAL